jgi:hypothetical protein
VYTTQQNNAIVKTKALIKSVIKAVRQQKLTVPGINSFIDDTETKIRDALDQLARENLILMEASQEEQFYVIPFFYDKVVKAYEGKDSSIETPFPGDSLLDAYKFPKKRIRYLELPGKLIEYLSFKDKENYEDGEMEIIRLEFEEENGAVLTAGGLIPQNILQVSLLKLRDYITRYADKDYFQEMLKSHFTQRKTAVVNLFQTFMTGPQQTVELINSGEELSYTFWLYMHNMIKKAIAMSIEHNQERMQRDITLYQANSIILICNNYYRIAGQNKYKEMQIFAAIEKRMEAPPYHYTPDEICEFKDNQGKPLLQDYSKEDLYVFLKEKTEGTLEELPRILTFRSSVKETWYVKKTCANHFCEKLISEASNLVRPRIENRWKGLLKDYFTENTMHDNHAFESLIYEIIETEMPYFLPIIRGKKLELALTELQSGGGKSSIALYEAGKPVALGKLLDLQEEPILREIRAGLPFWYAVDFVVRFIGYILHGPRRDIIFERKKKPKNAPLGKRAGVTSLDLIMRNLVPPGNTAESELNVLAEKWNQLLDRSAQKSLRSDVNSIVKGHLNFVLQTLKMSSITLPALEDIAESLIVSTGTLRKILAKKALKEYIVLYMVKLLKGHGAREDAF